MCTSSFYRRNKTHYFFVRVLNRHVSKCDHVGDLVEILYSNYEHVIERERSKKDEAA